MMRCPPPSLENSCTQGVDLSAVTVSITVGGHTRDTRVVLFDFGGHFEYWPIRAQFLSKDCLVAVTFDMTAFLEPTINVAVEQVMLWVEAVKGSLAPGSTVGVLVVGTHLDTLRTEWLAKHPTHDLELFLVWAGRMMARVYDNVTTRLDDGSDAVQPMGWTALSLVEPPLEDAAAPPSVSSLICIPGHGEPSTLSPTSSPAVSVLEAAVSMASSAFPQFSSPVSGNGVVELVRRWILLHDSSSPSAAASAHGDLPAVLKTKWHMSLDMLSAVLLQLSKDETWFTITSDEVVPVVTHLASSGCVLVCPSDAFTRADSMSPEDVTVITRPDFMGKLLACVMNHRYVGRWLCDAETEALLNSTAPAAVTDPDTVALGKEAEAMQDPVVVPDGLRPDEELYVKRSILTRRFLTRVLLNPLRPRTKKLLELSRFPSSFELDTSAVWQLLQTAEYGIVVQGVGSAEREDDQMFIPHLAFLRQLTAPGQTKDEVVGQMPGAGGPPLARDRFDSLMRATWGKDLWGIQDGTAGETVPTELDSSVAGSVFQRGWRARHLPPDLFAKIVRQLLSPCGPTTKEVVGGPALWMSDQASPDGPKEHVVVWFQFAGSQLPPPTSAAQDGAKRALRLMARMQSRGEVRVVGWYDGPLSGDAGTYRDHPLFARVWHSIATVLAQPEYADVLKSEFVPLVGKMVGRRAEISWSEMEEYARLPSSSKTNFAHPFTHIAVPWRDLAPMSEIRRRVWIETKTNLPASEVRK